jgi:hypothetical protein
MTFWTLFKRLTVSGAKNVQGGTHAWMYRLAAVKV